MNPEKYVKPDLTQTPGRAEQLAHDCELTKQKLEDRLTWLKLERKNNPSPDRRGVLDEHIGRVSDMLRIASVSLKHFTEDDKLRFLHDVAHILGEEKYAHNADIIPFPEKRK